MSKISDRIAVTHAKIEVDIWSIRLRKLWKWIAFSVILASLPFGFDALDLFFGQARITLVGLFGNGEMYLVIVGMLGGAAGEMLFDRLQRGLSDYTFILLLLSCTLVSFIALFSYSSNRPSYTADRPRQLTVTRVQDKYQVSTPMVGGRADAIDVIELDRRRAVRTADFSCVMWIGALLLGGATVLASERRPSK